MAQPLPPQRLPQYRAKHFASIHSLVEHLEDCEDGYTYVYRGQIERLETFVFPTDDGGQADVEPLFPSDFRFIRSHTNAPAGEIITSMRERGRDRRDLFCKWILARASGGDERLTWLQQNVESRDSLCRAAFSAAQEQAEELDLKGIELVLGVESMRIFSQPLMRTCWSLAQHYCLPTCLLDCTHSVRVAAWFATHYWDARVRDPDKGIGVIYRICLDKLIPIMQALQHQHEERATAAGLSFPPPEMFVFDLAEIPSWFATRPANQQGLSIYGFDRLELIQFTFFAGAAEVFSFDHGDHPFEDGYCTRDILQPSNDPFCAVIHDFLGEHPESAP